MKFIIDTEENIAKKAAQRYVEILNRKPDTVLGFATGSTPLGLYAELQRLNAAGALSFKDVTTFNLDEYAGLDGSHDQSYRYFMDHNLFMGVDIDRSRTHVPSGLDIAAAADYDRQIKEAGGIELQLLGIGNNGHIGFNEPGTPIDSITHLVDLTEMTRKANARFFASLDEVPTQAVTMGIKTVMNARSIMLMALGKGKADIVKKSFTGPVTPEVPASILQLHPFVEIYLDYEAASML